MARKDHEFQFRASQIRDAAKREAEYHEAREEYWKQEYAAAFNRVQETISAKIVKQPISGGGFNAVVTADYGDQAAYARMNTAGGKIQTHRREAERFRSEEAVYGSQCVTPASGAIVAHDRIYELTSDDVHYFRLGTEPRED